MLGARPRPSGPAGAADDAAEAGLAAALRRCALGEPGAGAELEALCGPRLLAALTRALGGDPERAEAALPAVLEGLRAEAGGFDPALGRAEDWVFGRARAHARALQAAGPAGRAAPARRPLFRPAAVAPLATPPPPPSPPRSDDAPPTPVSAVRRGAPDRPPVAARDEPDDRPRRGGRARSLGGLLLVAAAGAAAAAGGPAAVDALRRGVAAVAPVDEPAQPVGDAPAAEPEPGPAPSSQAPEPAPPIAARPAAAPPPSPPPPVRPAPRVVPPETVAPPPPPVVAAAPSPPPEPAQPAGPPGRARVFLHHAAGDAGDAALAARLAAELRQAGFDVAGVRAVGFRIGAGSVRYFFDRDRPEARRLLEVANRLLARAGGGPARGPADFTHFDPKPAAGTVELWLPGG